MRGIVLTTFFIHAYLCTISNAFSRAFSSTSSRPHPCISSSSCLSMSTASSSTTIPETTELNKESSLLKRDRYVATNRFAVRDGREAKFEKRWATRKSRLASLEGFRYFHLMRRVSLNEDGTCTYDGGDSTETSAGNYVSFTIWEKKSDFSAWRKGDAFKEAHGGTSITAFVSTMIGSAFVLRGPPRPAFYDGLLLQSTKPKDTPEIVDGWRAVEADGVETLPSECFVACNQFYVPSDNAAAFEKRWAERESKLKECDGFVAFSMLRRDAKTQGHGTVPVTSDEPSYLSTTIWKDRKSFDNWRSGSAFKQAHGSNNSGEDKSSKPNNNDGKEGKPASVSAPLWTKPPSPVFYEGTLVISCEDGA